METIYWLLEEDFGGYSYGLSQGKENIPEGATTFASEGDLNEAVKAAEKNAVKAFEKEQAELEKIEADSQPKVEKEKVKTPPGQDKKDLNQVERKNG